jgi:hypothetical protein
MFSSALEIQNNDFSNFSSVISFILSIFGLLLGICFTFVALMVFYKARENHDPDKKWILMEMLTDIKDTKTARLYAFMLLARRTLFVLIIVFLVGELNRSVIYLFLAGIQLVYILFIVSIHTIIYLDHHPPIQ